MTFLRKKCLPISSRWHLTKNNKTANYTNTRTFYSVKRKHFLRLCWFIFFFFLLAVIISYCAVHQVFSCTAAVRYNGMLLGSFFLYILWQWQNEKVCFHQAVHYVFFYGIYIIYLCLHITRDIYQSLLCHLLLLSYTELHFVLFGQKWAKFSILFCRCYNIIILFNVNLAWHSIYCILINIKQAFHSTTNTEAMYDKNKMIKFMYEDDVAKA